MSIQKLILIRFAYAILFLVTLILISYFIVHLVWGEDRVYRVYFRAGKFCYLLLHTQRRFFHGSTPTDQPHAGQEQPEETPAGKVLHAS